MCPYWQTFCLYCKTIISSLLIKWPDLKYTSMHFETFQTIYKIHTVFTVISAPGAYKIIPIDQIQIPHDYLSLPVFKSRFYYYPSRFHKHFQLKQDKKKRNIYIMMTIWHLWKILMAETDLVRYYMWFSHFTHSGSGCHAKIN